MYDYYEKVINECKNEIKKKAHRNAKMRMRSQARQEVKESKNRPL